ncbi:ASCH domain-containing protein [Geomicrobium sp. JCM 19038]|uniref:ASCH domain-containing protein n=1 Tax=Geomicrobium sp. JCM 19038 TaxID=1460635 RepID=UPI00045F3ABB|nr:ASCH domain-containing protein [Geomicrobium sp. JCM 19038]GAK07159.1 hypothetical protein JCM19038_880 [Geomicrobium sp. JCM 19038]
MTIHERTMVFGWENDGGIGEKLIQEIIDGTKTTTCALKAEYTVDQMQEVYRQVHERVTILNKHGVPKVNVVVVDVYETTFGQPDSRLVEGEGYGRDIHGFQEAHRLAWGDLGVPLKEDTILIVEQFKKIDN